VRIGIVSDTHLMHKGRPLPKALVEGLSGVDMILHAGDWVALWVAEDLGRIAPVEGVAGNNDGPEIAGRYGYQRLVQAAGITIGIVHGDGRGKTTEQRAYEAFAGEAVDVIIFGHSHIPYMEQRGGVLLFNPGSPTDKRRQPLYSYGILTVTADKRVEAQHFYYDSRD
jgi:uncharacterized protein